MIRISVSLATIAVLLCINLPVVGQPIQQKSGTYVSSKPDPRSRNARLRRYQEEEITIDPVNLSFDSLKALVKFTGDTLKITFTFKDAVYGNDKTAIRLNRKITLTKAELFQLTQTYLRSKNLAIVGTDNENIMQIIPLGNIRPFTPEGQAANEKNKGKYITQVFPLKNITTDQAKKYITQFFSSDPNANASSSSRLGPITELPKLRILLVTETVSNLLKIQKLLERFDKQSSEVETRFIKVNSNEAEVFVEKLKEILGLRAAAQKGEKAVRSFGENVSIASDAQTNRVILIGPKKGVDEVAGLLKELDGTKETMKTKPYTVRYITPKRLDDLIRRTFGDVPEARVKFFYKSIIVEGTNQLIVTTRDDIHRRIELIAKQLDRQPDESTRQSPIAYYKLRYVKAADILKTIQAVEQSVRSNDGQDSTNRNVGTSRGISSVNDNTPSTNYPPRSDNPSRQVNGVSDNRINFFEDPQGSPNRNQGFLGQQPSIYDELIEFRARDIAGQRQLIPGQAEVTIDENSNQLIVVAEPSVQRLYKELIEKLDRPRPQVLIEVTVVTIDCDDARNLGIEISGGDRTGARRVFAFTQFGLSSADPMTGALSILPGLGFNGTLIDPETADIVLRALSTHTRSRVVSAPRILVNDNSKGTLSSVAEVPYSQVNASNTVATTSLGGFAEAGTTISVTPQIGEGNNLNLEFDVIVSDFTAAASTDLPPPRTLNQVTSTVSIPDGHTVIVGGLSRKSTNRTQRGIPFVENIPIFRLISGNIEFENDNQNIYVFVKPIILRDDKFRDLRHLSEIERRKACIPDDLPKSCPILIK